MATFEIPTLDGSRRLREKFLPLSVVTATELEERLAGFTPGNGGGTSTPKAADVTFVPGSTIEATNVQAAVSELAGDVAGKVTSHSGTVKAVAYFASLPASESAAVAALNAAGVPAGTLVSVLART